LTSEFMTSSCIRHRKCQ